MLCPRCKSPMIHSHIVEREELGDWYLSITRGRNECPNRSATVSVSLPTYYKYPKEEGDVEQRPH